MHPLAAAIGLCGLAISATGCTAVALVGSQLFKDDEPRCAGTSATGDGGDCRQAAVETEPYYCFRTIGIADCHTEEDPYGATATGRALSHPIVRPDRTEDASSPRTAPGDNRGALDA